MTDVTIELTERQLNNLKVTGHLHCYTDDPSTTATIKLEEDNV